ncbi:MAG: 3-isopropylmalate dehydratase small subunit [Thaumarchaeota archaeon]|nr:3-isopropylmalate dehydratase small subunit [Nitrososphaerota archaeon]MBI3640799.1 3-isopropylmalate dehydratase small subunit [Nitrososphaerota archaeon]
MEPFKKIKSIVTPLDKVNVDTDQIIPKQFLKLVQKTGFGQYLFYDWRFENGDKPREDFVLNNPKYCDSKILLTRDNFGCGSSREHAAWALLDYGFRVVIAPSFADIFYNNCFKNGILPIRLDSQSVEKLFNNSSEIEADLQNQTIAVGDIIIPFEIESHRKKTLLEGLDDIAVTLQYEDKITIYEKSKSKL